MSANTIQLAGGTKVFHDANSGMPNLPMDLLKRKKWLEKLKLYTEKEEWNKKHPWIPDYKPRLTEPSPTWHVFYRQQAALDCAATHKENVHVFAFEPEDPSISPGKGTRRYCVTSYAQLWHVIHHSFKHNKPCTYYEIIPEGAACKLYFDLEFDKKYNPDKDGPKMVKDLIKFLCSGMKETFNVSCDSSHVICLDASTEKKFSCHLIFSIPNVAFKDNIHAGNFVQKICEEIEPLSAEDVCHEPSSKRQKVSTSGFPLSKEDFKGFLTTSSDGKTSLFIDKAVYTKNRNFRLYKCTKRGKSNPLLISSYNQFKPQGGALQNHINKEKELFMESVITNICWNNKLRILTCDRDIPNFAQTANKCPTSSVHDSDQKREGFKSSPYPTIDQFITSRVNKGGVQGQIRRWVFFPDGGLIIYDIVNNRWCDNIGRAHKSNNIMILADLKRGTFYQKCHDPECRSANYKSPEQSIPIEHLPFFDDYDDNELLEAVEEAERSFEVEKSLQNGDGTELEMNVYEDGIFGDFFDDEGNEKVFEVIEEAEKSFRSEHEGENEENSNLVTEKRTTDSIFQGDGNDMQTKSTEYSEILETKNSLEDRTPSFGKDGGIINGCMQKNTNTCHTRDMFGDFMEDGYEDEMVLRVVEEAERCLINRTEPS